MAGILAIAYFTLFPFDFHVEPGRTIRATLSAFDTGFSAAYVWEDVPLNVLLFTPLGFGVAGMVSGRRGGATPIIRLAAAALVGFFVSGLCEFIQGYALVRAPSVADVIANTLGAVVGALVFVLVGPRLLGWTVRGARSIGRRSTAPRLAAGVAVYVGALVAVMIWSPSATALSGWDPDFPLIVGNEDSRDRPWVGTMMAAEVLDRSLTDDEVERWRDGGAEALDQAAFVVRYDFTAGGPGFPPLEWQNGTPFEGTVEGVRLDAGRWLRSTGSVAGVSAALERSSEFTVLVEAATADLDQEGPARLVSISGGVFGRNLTVAQDEADLVLRFRTPLTGFDGSDPEIVVPGIFSDTDLHDIVVRYDGSIVRVGVDSATADDSIEFAPEAVLLFGSFPNEVPQVRSTVVRATMFDLLTRMIIFLPVAAAIAWSWRRRPDERRRAIGALVAAVVLLPAALEIVLTATIDPYRFRFGLVALGSVVLVVGFVAIARPYRRSAGSGGSTGSGAPRTEMAC